MFKIVKTKKLETETATARFLGVSRQTLFNWRTRGCPHSHNENNNVQYYIPDVILWRYGKNKYAETIINRWIRGNEE